MTIALTGGGTGGHIYPALSIGAALARLGVDTLYIGNASGLEASLVPRHGVRFLPIADRGPGRNGAGGYAARTFAMLRGVPAAAGHLRRNKVSAIVGTGGYASAHVVLAGALLRIPVVLHEPNAVAGRANIWLSRFAARVAVGFEATRLRLPGARCDVTGVAIRVPMVGPSPAEARRHLGLEPDRPTLLVVGGSQGAVALNAAAAAALDRLGGMGLQVLHQTGPKHFEEAAREASVTRPWYRAFPYIDDMAYAYAAADVAVTRAGASTVAELALHRVPALLVPYPFAADDHQKANALEMERAGAARMMAQSDLAAESLVAAVEQLLVPGTNAAMRGRLAELARPDAAATIAGIARTLAAARDNAPAAPAETTAQKN